jgi:hypothetical protein
MKQLSNRFVLEINQPAHRDVCTHDSNFSMKENYF